MIKKIGTLARNKKLTVNCVVSPEDKVMTALKKMSYGNLGAVLVMENDKIVGIFTERDYARKLILNGRSSFRTFIHQVMTTKVIYVTEDYTLEECLDLMNFRKIRHLPVFEGGQVISLVALEDVTGALRNRQEVTILELTKYITGELVHSETEEGSRHSELGHFV